MEPPPANPPDGAAPRFGGAFESFEHFEEHVNSVVRGPAFEPFKRALSVALGTLPPDKLAGVVEIIKSSPSHVGSDDDDEIELDMDALDAVDVDTLWKIDEYVQACKKEPDNSPHDDKVTRAQLRQEAEGLKHLRRSRRWLRRRLQQKEEAINNDLRAQQARREADPVHNMLLGMEKQIKASVAALPAAQRGTTITCDGWYGAERDSFTQGAWANQMLKYINDPANPLEDREEVLRMTAESLDLPDWGKEDQSKDGPGVTGAAPAAGNGQADAASKEERLAAGLKVLEDRLKANEDSA